jgi:hypothetical protein
MSSTPRTVIGVPGHWADRSEIVTSIATRSAGYLFAGAAMVKIGTEESFGLEVYEHDPRLKKAFLVAGGKWFPAADLDWIESHTFTLYLVAEGGSVPAARAAMHAANGLLKAGGIAVKVESTGIAHRADQWAECCSRNDLASLLWTFVTYIGGKGNYYSCGMHNLGYPDAVIEAEIPPDDAAGLLHKFLAYQLIENPTLKDRETFSIQSDAPRYRMFHEPCAIYQTDDLFHNPFGIWKLVPA